MRLILCAASLLIANLYALQREQPASPQRYLPDGSELLAPIQIDNLTLIPIVATDRTGSTDVLTLDEAMQDRRLRVSELAERAGALEFANAADQPVLVLAGELLLGGKQDRVVATSALIPPHSTRAIPVRCVEHGRWSGGDDFISAGRLAHDRLRGIAAYARQSDVWSEVARANHAHFTTNETDTYRNLAELQPAATDTLEARVYLALAELPETDRDRMIGYAVAYNGELATVDRFASPVVFGRLERKLLRAYLAEAIERRTDDTSDGRPPCIHAVREFIVNAQRGSFQQLFANSSWPTLIRRGTRVASSFVQRGDEPTFASFQRFLEGQLPQIHVEQDWPKPRYVDETRGIVFE